MSGLVTTTFHAPVAKPEVGQVPEDRVEELVKVKPEQVVVAYPLLVSVIVAPDIKLVPVIEVIVVEALLAPVVGEMAVTVGAGLKIVKLLFIA